MTKDEKMELISAYFIGKMYEAEKRLDACPFCGNEAAIAEPSFVLKDKYIAICARCRGCGVTSKAMFVPVDTITPEIVDVKLHNLVTWWNMRVKPGDRIKRFYESQEDEDNE